MVTLLEDTCKVLEQNGNQSSMLFKKKFLFRTNFRLKEKLQNQYEVFPSMAYLLSLELTVITSHITIVQ